MTEADDKPKNPALSVRHKIGMLLFALVVLLVAAAVVAVELRPSSLPGRNAPAPAVTAAPDNLAPVEARLGALEQKTATIEARIDDLAARFEKTVSGAAADGKLPADSAAAVARLQNDVTVLSAGFGALQTQVRQANDAALATQRMTQASLAAMLVFMQLREAAEAGRSFAGLLAAMQAIAKNDDRLVALLAGLEPYAASGAPGLPALREEFANLIGAADRALDQAGAASWRERLMAALKGLVSVRSVHDAGAGDALAMVESALAQSNLTTALDTVRSLPPAVRQVLDGWRMQAEARQKIDAILLAVADRLTAAAGAEPAIPASAQGAP